MGDVGITVYSCEEDEANMFAMLAKGMGAEPKIVGQAISNAGIKYAHGNRCISVGHKSKVTARHISSLHMAGVKYISTRSIGINHIDIEAANKIGITVENVTYSPESVADYTLMLILMLLRGAKQTLINTENNDFRLCPNRGIELREMTVGVVGTGRIGTAVIHRLQSFGCKIITCDISGGHSGVQLEELLRLSDIITLHIPLNKHTYHIISNGALAHIKRGSYFVNTARGALVDTEALICALSSGILAGAALDVIEGEQGLFYYDYSKKVMPDTYLQTLKRMANVIVTPHTAYYTANALHDIVRNTILNCIDFEKRFNA